MLSHGPLEDFFPFSKANLGRLAQSRPFHFLVSPVGSFHVSLGGCKSYITSICLGLLEKRHTVDGRNPAPPRKPWNDDTNKPLGFPWIRSGAGFRPSTVFLVVDSREKPGRTILISAHGSKSSNRLIFRPIHICSFQQMEDQTNVHFSKWKSLSGPLYFPVFLSDPHCKWIGKGKGTTHAQNRHPVLCF